MKRNVKLSGLILLGTLVVLAVAVLSLNREASPDQSEANKIVVMQPNTHILQDAGDGAPILVEFLDFECEACGAFYPYIEELKKEFVDGKSDLLDGLTINCPEFWFNIRASNTEPVMRLNPEAYNEKILKSVVAKVTSIIEV